MNTLKGLNDAIAEIQRTLEDNALENQMHQKAFDQLYAELQQYKEDFLFKAEKPLILDLLLFFDSMVWFKENIEQQNAKPEIVAESFQYLLDEFLELLARRDILPMEPKENFDKTRQRAMKVVHTKNPQLDEKILKVIKKGFMRGDRVLRAEEVIVQKKTS